MKKKLTRREVLGVGAKVALGFPFFPSIISANALRRSRQEFCVIDFGAAGDGTTLDTRAIQMAIDKAAATGGGARVIFPGGYRFTTGTIMLKSNIDFHLADDAEIVISTDENDYERDAVLTCQNTRNLKISGTGNINGRALKFMANYEEEARRWKPGKWRPRMFQLNTCRGLEIENISFGNAPFWGLHMVGCEDVLIDNLTIRNHLEVPNSDGINPDHCRNVEIKNCDIRAGDDNIVIKTTRQRVDYGPSAHIHVYDCRLQSQSSGIKIGTETTDDIYDILFERCQIRDSNRACTIQSRDEGAVYNIEFRDIDFTIRQVPSSWWGLGEGISITSFPRSYSSDVGGIQNVRLINIKGLAENSIRVNGCPDSRIKDILLNDVDIQMKRHTKYKGGRFDNRPTQLYDEIETCDIPGYSLRYVDNITLSDCSIQWAQNPRKYYTHAILAESVTGLKVSGFEGDAAHPQHYDPVVLK
ncbi:glycosyl hydrolase family 28 protein [Aliifodinibius sp. S!AR15-10]|uniref:glycoside hydrolase family 28 protein n=1 Tax=Aliifodinibius sp. S!AR15-10 TaxID=2950437 RepID=UPI0028555ED0|nr:glycosyl hydrolase family 28 protein [Aliifodinibius sp. S!AR15-10]MDR8390182.1 glycosyl hydrolase family 28 protein [Aliifodinibius sp. S!AR15-10]